jgi:LuxR family maltose regulon positive regulatory protein
VTLVVAPAGYGKTTLVSSWFQRQKNSPVAWFTLDREDAAPERFLSYLSAAIKEVGFDSQSAVEKSFPPDDLDAAIAWVDTLLFGLERAGRKFILVFDDYHLLPEDSLPNLILSYLIAHLPANIHVIVLSRRTPKLGLSRLWLDDNLAQIDSESLSFTQADTAEFLRGFQPTLIDSDVQQIQESTRGWPAAIKLLSPLDASLQDLKCLTSGHAGSSERRNTPQALEELTDYLLEEIIDPLGAEIKQFLLVTSQVDVFCASLAEDLTGWDRITVGRILDNLLSKQAFIEKLPKGTFEPWYSYQPLFATVLKQLSLHTNSLEITAILKKASRWFEQNGNWNQSAIYAHRIKDWQHIVHLISDNWRTMSMEDNMFMLYCWGKMLPDDLLSENPLVCSMLELPALLAEDVAFSSLCEEIALGYFSDESLPYYAEAMANHAHVCGLERRFDEAALYKEIALARLPASDYSLRSKLQQMELYATPAPDWLRYRTTTLELLPQILAHGNDVMISNNYAFLGFAEAVLGNFTNALQYIEKFFNMIPSRASVPLRPTFMNAYFTRMSAAYHQGRIGEAELNQQKHIEIPKLSFAPHLRSLSLMYKALFEYTRADLPEANRWFADSTELSPYGLLMVYLPLEFIIHLKGARLFDFEAFLESTRVDYGHSSMWHRLNFTDRLIEGELSELSNLKAAIENTAEDRRLDLISAQLLLSLYEEKIGNNEAAENALQKAIDYAKPEYIVQLFSNDYQLILPILSRLSQTTVVGSFTQDIFIRLSQIANGEADLAHGDNRVQLTQRESDVLYLLVSGHQVNDIAQRLAISRETVRKHIANIYAKYKVHSRTQLLLQIK